MENRPGATLFRPLAAALGIAMMLITALSAPALAAPDPRIDLKVLVIQDGGPATEAITAQLQLEGVPHEVVDLNSGSRKTISAEMLSGTVVQDGASTRLARYQSIVLPNASPAALSDAEKAAILAYQAEFDIRGVYAYTVPTPDVGLNWSGFGYSGTLDGLTGTVTQAGKDAGFGYLNGPVPFEDLSTSVWESYGYVSTVLPDQQPGASFQPLVTMDAGSVDDGPIVGVYDRDGVENLVVTFVYRSEQSQFRLLAHGMVSWMTRGVHLGYERSYLGVHVDDVFLPDARWSMSGNCTPGEDCTNNETTSDIRMTAADARAVGSWTDSLAARWSTAGGFTLDMVFNGVGIEQAIAAQTGPRRSRTDPMSDVLLAERSKYRWINHTWSHAYFGCVQDFSTVPWTCATDPATGQILWTSQEAITNEINRNLNFAKKVGLTNLPRTQYNPTELVTGEHSGLQRLPNEPTDNPNLAPALNATGIRTVASDASREQGARGVGNAVAVPRYPISVFFNTATEAEMVDEYNWIYTSRADGGSGYCEDHPETTTCIAPLNPSTGFSDYIVPFETRQSLRRMASNDPRPLFAHQSNLAEDRLLLTMLDSILGAYDSLYADNRPVVSPPFTQMRDELLRQQTWRGRVNTGAISAYQVGSTVTVVNTTGGTVAVPLTLPEGTTQNGAAFGQAYSGERSAVVSTAAGQRLTYQLPVSLVAAIQSAELVPATTDDVTTLLVPEEQVADQPITTPELLIEETRRATRARSNG